MSANIPAPPFEPAHILRPNDFHRETGEQFRAVIGARVFMSLGALPRDLRAVPGRYGQGGLMVIARILPFNRNGERSENPRRMAVMVSLTPADEIDVEAREIHSGKEHAKVEGIHFDQLARVMLALDYDGPEALNPAYW